MILEFVEAYYLGVVNTFFKKKNEDIITCKSGGNK